MSHFNHTISAILRGKWMIDRMWVDAHMPVILGLLEGKPVSFVERDGQEDDELPFGIDPKTMQRVEIFQRSYYGVKPVANVPNGTVAIMPITGPITKYDGTCGEPGMITRNSRLLNLFQRDSIAAVIQLMDTPGGEARAVSAYNSSIKKRNKPVLTLVDNMCASAGMWLAAGTDEIYATDELSDIGSVGAYCTYADFTGYYEQMGIKLHEVYAPQSSEKNIEYRNLMEGLPEGKAAIEADLKKMVDVFINQVKAGRGDKAVANEAMWNKGKLGDAAWATKAGLIDGIKPMEQVVSKAAWLAKRKNS